MARQLVTSFDFTGTVDTTPSGLSVFKGANLTLDGNGNARVTTNSSSQGSFINTGAYTSNQYGEVTVTGASSAPAGHVINLGVRAQSEDNGYTVTISTASVNVNKVVAASFNLVANVAGGQTWAAGDKFSVEIEDNGSNQPVFRVYKTPSGGSQTQIGSDVTDTGASPYTGGRPLLLLRQDGAPTLLVTGLEGGNVVAGVTGTMSTTLSAFTMSATGTVGTAPKRAVFSVAAANHLQDATQVAVTQNNVPYAVYKASLLTALGTLIETGTVNVVSGECTINIGSASVVVGDTVTILFDDGTNRATRTLVTT